MIGSIQSTTFLPSALPTRAAVSSQAGPLDRVEVGGALPPALMPRSWAASGPAATSPATALAEEGAPHAVQILGRTPSHMGGWIEHLRDADPHFPQRNFHPRQVQRHPEVVAAFGTATPHSGDVLLHYAGDPPPGVPVHETPVVLIHGASKDGTFWWDPAENGSGGGLPQYLQAQGYNVYAVTFAHNQDDNYLQAQQTANAVARVRTLTGAPKVDLISHSKGTVAARAYLSDFRAPWMSRYQQDVRRAVFVAGPMGGIDYSFRHADANLALVAPSDSPRLNAPMSWDSVNVLGVPVDTRDRGFGGDGADHWPGQRQMLDRWDDVYPVPIFEQDWYTTYHGGQGFVGRSRGIDHFMHDSGDFMPRLEATPIAHDVDVAILAGNMPDIPGILNEYSGPSDGVVFVRSATQAPEGARVVAEKVLPMHHKALVTQPRALKWIEQVLAADRMDPLSPVVRQEIVEKGVSQGEAFITRKSDRDLDPALSIA